jgi:hypothetical protein
VKWFVEKTQTHATQKKKTGIVVLYTPRDDGTVTVQALADNEPTIEVVFTKAEVDEAHILYNQATELLDARTKLGEHVVVIRKALEHLFAVFRGDAEPMAVDHSASQAPSGDFKPNPGKKIEIDVDGKTYLRLPVKTRLITTRDTDILPLINEYVTPFLQNGDMLFVSEKVLAITQNRIVDFSDIHPTWLARFLARNVSNYYGSRDFHGFGHGTSLAMQLFLEEAGYPRVLFAAAVAVRHQRSLLQHLRQTGEVDRLPDVFHHHRVRALREARSRRPFRGRRAHQTEDGARNGHSGCQLPRSFQSGQIHRIALRNIHSGTFQRQPARTKQRNDAVLYRS